MKKLVIFFLLNLLIITDTFSQKLTSILYPANILKNSRFEISFIGTCENINYDLAYLYLIVNDGIEVKKASIYFEKNNFDLNIRKEKNSYGNVINIKIDKDIFENALNSAYQIIVTLQAGENSTDQILYVLGASKGTKKYLFNSSFISSNSPKIPSKINLSFHDKGNKAGKNLSIKQKGTLTFSTENENIKNKLMLEFWMKNGDIKGNWFDVKDINQMNSLFTVGLNKFRLLTLTAPNETFFYDDFYLSKNQWYHINILLDDYLKTAKIFIDDKLFYSFQLKSEVILNKLELSIFNSSEKGTVEIDGLKLWDFNSDLEESFKNKNSYDYRVDNSNLLFSSSFDDYATFNRKLYDNKRFVIAKYYDFNESDAPLFSKIPSLNVEVYSEYNSIEWLSSDLSASRFILEKSENGTDYSAIYITDSSNDLLFKYFYSDAKDTDSKVIYYRLKQINNNGKTVYSNQIKVGVAEKPKFEIKQNFPNPFNPFTSITVDVFESTDIEIAVYNVVGKEIALLNKGTLSAGAHSFKFDGTGLPSGIYFCKVTSGNMTKVQKMILTK